MPTTLILLRHAATPANLAHPALLQGRKSDPALAPVGVRQAAATAALLKHHPIQAAYCSPMIRAIQTAEIVLAPHELSAKPIEELTECHVGRWEGLSWDLIRINDPVAHAAFMSNPAENGYPGGESFADVFERAGRAIDNLLDQHDGQTVLIVSHHIVNRTYLAGCLGMPMSQARKISLDNCGVSIVNRDTGRNRLVTLNTAIHLDGIDSGGEVVAA